MSYQYDVFLSYRRGERLLPGGDISIAAEGRWVHQVFLDSFRESLVHAYPKASVITDKDLIVGKEWDPQLRDWHRRSRCMVAVWSPMYFRSEYCRSEWRSMRARERLLPGGVGKPSLVVPISFKGTDAWFDSAAKARHFAIDFAWTSGLWSRVKRSQHCLKWQKAMDELCLRVAASIRAAPEWCAEFPWIDSESLPPRGDYPLPTLA